MMPSHCNSRASRFHSALALGFRCDEQASGATRNADLKQNETIMKRPATLVREIRSRLADLRRNSTRHLSPELATRPGHHDLVERATAASAQKRPPSEFLMNTRSTR